MRPFSLVRRPVEERLLTLQLRAAVPVPRPREPGGFALRPVPVPPRERCCTGRPGSWVRGCLGYPGVLMTHPQAGKQPSSGTNRPVPSIRATGDRPGTLIPLAGRLQQYQGRYLRQGKANSLLCRPGMECLSGLARGGRGT